MGGSTNLEIGTRNVKVGAGTLKLEPSGRRLRPSCMFFDVLALIICVCAACLLYITAPDLD